MGIGRPREKPKEWKRDVQVIPGREGKLCVCRCALCVQGAGPRGPFHAPPQLKPRNEVNSGKEGERVFERGTEAWCEEFGKGTQYCCMLCVERERGVEKRRRIWKVKDGGAVSLEFVIE